MSTNLSRLKYQGIKLFVGDEFLIPKVVYLIVGGFNTLIGYFIGIGLYNVMSPHFHILVIGIVTNILAITVSFSTYKVFVFRTQGLWLREYFRSYLVYGGMALVAIFLLWILVVGQRLPIWLAQGVVILITTILSYLGHSRFTFRHHIPIKNRQTP